MTKTAEPTPLRSALRKDSSLLESVRDGLGAVKSTHRTYFEERVRLVVADSLDADEALREGNDQANRWDYLLGHAESRALVGVEPHSAKEDEIGTVIRKRAAALQQLRAHLRDGVQIAKWLWVASGKVHFSDTEKARRRLDQNGIEFVGTRVMAKHLPTPSPPPSRRARVARRTRR
jgi:hypothetical protein